MKFSYPSSIDLAINININLFLEWFIPLYTLIDCLKSMFQTTIEFLIYTFFLYLIANVLLFVSLKVTFAFPCGQEEVYRVYNFSSRFFLFFYCFLKNIFLKKN